MEEFFNPGEWYAAHTVDDRRLETGSNLLLISKQNTPPVTINSCNTLLPNCCQKGNGLAIRCGATAVVPVSELFSIGIHADSWKWIPRPKRSMMDPGSFVLSYRPSNGRTFVLFTFAVIFSVMECWHYTAATRVALPATSSSTTATGLYTPSPLLGKPKNSFRRTSKVNPSFLTRRLM